MTKSSLGLIWSSLSQVKPAWFDSGGRHTGTLACWIPASSTKSLAATYSSQLIKDTIAKFGGLLLVRNHPDFSRKGCSCHASALVRLSCLLCVAKPIRPPRYRCATPPPYGPMFSPLNSFAPCVDSFFLRLELKFIAPILETDKMIVVIVYICERRLNAVSIESVDSLGDSHLFDRRKRFLNSGRSYGKKIGIRDWVNSYSLLFLGATLTRHTLTRIVG